MKGVGLRHFCSIKQAFEQQYSLEAGKGACPADVALSGLLFEVGGTIEAANYIVLIVQLDFVGRSLPVPASTGSHILPKLVEKRFREGRLVE